MFRQEGLPVEARKIGDMVARTPPPKAGCFNRAYHTNNASGRNPDVDAPGVKIGDVGSIDEAVFIHIRGLAKDMIISSGPNFNASGIEGVICDHPASDEAAVVGVPD